MTNDDNASAIQGNSKPETQRPQQTSATFRFQKIGPVLDAEMGLGDLTVIAGRNNTGKTYIAYTLYGFLKSLNNEPTIRLDPTDSYISRQNMLNLAEELLKSRQIRVPMDSQEFSKERREIISRAAAVFSVDILPTIFSSRTAFKHASFDVQLGNSPPSQDYRREKRLGGGSVLSCEYNGKELVLTLSSSDHLEHPFEVASYISNFYSGFLFSDMPLNPFVLSAERFGISLFYRELDFTRNNLVDALQQMADDRSSANRHPYLFIDSTTSRYALPIKHNIDYTRSIPDLKDSSEVHADKLYDYIKDMLGGYYSTADGGIRFMSKARRKDRKFDIPLHLASTSARGLSDFYFFLRYVAEKHQLLIIDEPESHLDTSNQIRMARLLARCVRAGLKVLITTHSDFLVKELNNLIMLNSSFPNRESVVKRLQYEPHDSIPPNSVRAYVAEGNSLTKCKVDEFGIEMPVFDDTIRGINRVSNELVMRLQENEL